MLTVEQPEHLTLEVQEPELIMQQNQMEELVEQPEVHGLQEDLEIQLVEVNQLDKMELEAF